MAGYHLQGSWPSRFSTKKQQIIKSDNLNLYWQGLSLNAPATLVLNQQPVSGKGYVERLDIECKKIVFPFNRLQWGCFIATESDRALVWIQFNGESASTRLFDEAGSYTCAEISAQQIRYQRGNLTIKMEKELLSARIVDHIPCLLRNLFPATLLAGQ